MNRLRVAIVDDEPLARARLRRLLALHADVEIIGDFAGGPELLAACGAQPPELLLLDIEMPEMDGFSIVRQLSRETTRIVFVSAYSEHAARAFDIDACDYLVKPVAPDRLRQTLDRALRARRPPATGTAAAPVFATRLALPCGRRTELVDVARIDCVLAQANYVEIRAGARCFLLRRTLGDFQAELDPRVFTRIHRSAVVRLDAVADVESLDSGRYRLRLKNGGSLVSGRSYRESLRRALRLPL